MPTLSSQYLTVLNIFRTDAPEKQDRLIGAMREIVDTAAYEGWVSSTVHSGQEELGTANFIQWRSVEDLERRYAGEEFRHHTLPLFSELTTSVRLLQTRLAASFRHPSQPDATEISPTRDDYTVIEILDVEPENQEELVATLSQAQDWLAETPGWRSYNVFRGLRARGVGHGAHVTVPEGPPEGGFVVVYSQWDDRQSYDEYRTMPEEKQPESRQKAQARLNALITCNDRNTYRAVHTRSAGQ
jgi:heme-degrading monooxygenase HmoA